MMTKQERDDMRSAAQMSVTCKIDGPWEDIVACLDDLDEKDKEIKGMFAEIDGYRLKLIRLREVLDV